MSLRIDSRVRRPWLVGTALALLTGAVVVVVLSDSSHMATQGRVISRVDWPWQETGPHDTAGPSASAVQTAPPGRTRSPAELRSVLQQGSFAGTSPVGSWCVSATQNLAPCLGLRARFEYYINGLGEISSAEVRVLIEDEARRAHGDALAMQIMAVYDRYWLARNHNLNRQVDMADVTTWLPALEEAQRVRLQTLGAEWSKAFFSEDDQEFRETHQRALTGTPPPPSHRDPVPRVQPGTDSEALRAQRIERYGKAVTDELEVLDAKQRHFDEHLALARSEWRRLQDQPNLSEVARRQHLQGFIEQHFDPLDQRRVARLLGLTTP